MRIYDITRNSGESKANNSVIDFVLEFGIVPFILIKSNHDTLIFKRENDTWKGLIYDHSCENWGPFDSSAKSFPSKFSNVDLMFQCLEYYHVNGKYQVQLIHPDDLDEFMDQIKKLDDKYFDKVRLIQQKIYH